MFSFLKPKAGAQRINPSEAVARAAAGLEMQRAPVGVEHRFVHHLAQRRMREDGFISSSSVVSSVRPTT
jgi:hypothetical protein